MKRRNWKEDEGETRSRTSVCEMECGGVGCKVGGREEERSVEETVGILGGVLGAGNGESKWKVGIGLRILLCQPRFRSQAGHLHQCDKSSLGNKKGK